MAKIEKFNVTCKKCGSQDVELFGIAGQNTGYGILACQNPTCKEQESIDDFENEE